MSGPQRHLAERAAERLAVLQPVPDPPLPAAGVAPAAPPATTAPATTAPATTAPLPAPLPVPKNLGRAPDIGMPQMLLADMQLGAPGRTRITEEYAVFATHLLRARGGSTGAAPANLLMITSTQPGEGKSFTAINLAAALARLRAHDVILVDGDSKLHSVSARLGVADRPGLHDLARAPGLELEALLLTTAIPRMRVLPIGAAEQEVVTAERLVTVLHRLARKYPTHTVILDAAPCGATSDPAVMCADMGSTLLVVEADRTQQAELARSIAAISACANVMLMLNKTRLASGGGYAAYGYYGS